METKSASRADERARVEEQDSARDRRAQAVLTGAGAIAGASLAALGIATGSAPIVAAAAGAAVSAVAAAFTILGSRQESERRLREHMRELELEAKELEAARATAAHLTELTASDLQRLIEALEHVNKTRAARDPAGPTAAPADLGSEARRR